ncbi:transmembrane and TPR repeat-containing protein 4-like, partial [Scleropages formosus]
CPTGAAGSSCSGATPEHGTDATIADCKAECANALSIMALSDVRWDQQVPLPKLSSCQSRIVVGLAAVLCFANSYDGEFVFDDSEAIINNKDLKPETPLNNIWRNDFWGSNLSSNTSHKSYRPLTVLTFRLNYFLADGLHPVGFHVLNIALHSIVSVLMIDVFTILIGGSVSQVSKAAFLAALFFAVHPVHTESGVNAAFDVIIICNIKIYELSQRILFKRKLIEANELFRRGLPTRAVLLTCGGTLLLYMRWKIMGTGPPAFTEVDNPASFAENTFIRAVNYNYYYSLNAWLLLCPWWLCFDWSMGCVPLIESLLDWRIIWVLLLWICLALLMGQALCSQDSNKRRNLTFGLVLLVVPFLPASNLFFRVGFVIAERVLYLSTAGYCLILTYALSRFCFLWRNYKVKALTAVTPLLSIQLPSSSVKSRFVHYNVGKNLADRGNQSAAVRYYREAVRLHPKYVHAMNNLGNILKEKNELLEAEQLLSKAVHIQPDFAAAWMNLGIVQNSLKKFEDAEQSYWNAIRFRKKYPDCYYNLGRLYADLDRHLDALNAWRNATMLKPDHSLAWNNMVILLDNTGNLAQAEMIAKEALKVLPNDHTIMFSLANVLGKQQKYKESEGFFLNALKINPNAASCHGNLAVLYHRWGKLELAKKHYELSLQLDPNAPGTKDNFNMLKRKLEQAHKNN